MGSAPEEVLRGRESSRNADFQRLRFPHSDETVAFVFPRLQDCPQQASCHNVLARSCGALFRQSDGGELHGNAVCDRTPSHKQMITAAFVSLSSNTITNPLFPVIYERVSRNAQSYGAPTHTTMLFPNEHGLCTTSLPT